MTALEAGKNPQSEYTPEALAACEKALRTILKKIGPWGARLILIGGMVPRYLVGDVPKEIKEHVGTTDLDVVVGVTVSAEEEEFYRTLQQNLKDSGFAPAISSTSERMVAAVVGRPGRIHFERSAQRPRGRRFLAPPPSRRDAGGTSTPRKIPPAIVQTAHRARTFP